MTTTWLCRAVERTSRKSAFSNARATMSSLNCTWSSSRPFAAGRSGNGRLFMRPISAAAADQR